MLSGGEVHHRRGAHALQRPTGCEEGLGRCDNAKLLLDSWHCVRADQPLDLSVLEGLPAEKIVST